MKQSYMTSLLSGMQAAHNMYEPLAAVIEQLGRAHGKYLAAGYGSRDHLKSTLKQLERSERWIKRLRENLERAIADAPAGVNETEPQIHNLRASRTPPTSRDAKSAA